MSNIPDIIDEYDQLLSTVQDDLVLKGKTLQDANREQATLYATYAKKLQEVKTLWRWLDTHVDSVKGRRWAVLKESNNIALSSTDLNHYIAADTEYVQQKNLLIIVQELMGQYEVVVKAFEQRGYQLRNLTEMCIHEVNRFEI